MNSEVSDSDTDFWTDLEKPHLIPKQPVPRFVRKQSLLFDRKVPNENQYLDEKTIENEWVRSFYEDKIQRVRESTEEAINTSTIITRNLTKKRYTSTINELESKYNRDLYKLKYDFIKMRDFLIEKDKYTHDLIVLISEAGLHFSELSISSLQNKKKTEKPEKNLKEIEALIKEIKNLQAQASYLKEVCGIYQEDADKANKKADFFENEFIVMEKKYKAQITGMVEEQKNKEKEHREEIIKIGKE